VVGLAAVLVAGLGVAPSVVAQGDQNVERGFAPEKVYDFSGVDQVNLFNGNLSLTIPIGARYPVGGGLTYGLTLVYNSNVWKIDSRTQTQHPGPDLTYVTAEPHTTDNAGLGWTLSLGSLFPPNTDGYDRFRYIGEDGGEHLFYDRLHSGESSVSGHYYTRDGSYLRLRDLGSSAEVEMADGTVKRFEKVESAYILDQIRDRFNNTVTVTYGESAGGNTLWTIADGYRSHHVEFQKFGDYEVVKEVRLSSFGSPGPSAIWTFAYSYGWIARSCLDTDPANNAPSGAPSPQSILVPLLTSVAQPDGAEWEMASYNTTCAEDGVGEDEPNLPGTIEQLVLPTGGELAWTYRTYNYPTRGEGTGQDPPVDVPQVVGVATKQLNRPGGGCWAESGVGCVWSYTPQSFTGLNDPFYRTMTVRYPTGDEMVSYFSQDIRLRQNKGNDPDGNDLQDPLYHRGWHYGLPFKPPAEWATQDPNPPGGLPGGPFLSQQIYEGTVDPDHLQREVYVRYERDKIATGSGVDPDDWKNTNRRPAEEKTVFFDDTQRYSSSVSSEFDGLGHYRKQVTGGDLPGTNVRTSRTDYNHHRGTYRIDAVTNQPLGGHNHTAWPASLPWVLGTYEEGWVEQNGSPREVTQACFEAANGFLQRIRRLAGASIGPDDVLVNYGRNSKGDVITEQYFGGDEGPDVPHSGTVELCDLTPPSPDDYRLEHRYNDAYGVRRQTEYYTSGSGSMGFKTLDLTIDAGTGLPSASRDTAQVQTTYEYDAMGRLLWAKPAEGAWTRYAWFPNASPPRVEIDTVPNGQPGGTPLTQARIHFDGFGRPWRDFQKTPAGWTMVETDFNAMGWKAKVSERIASIPTNPTTPTFWTKFQDFDAFGRPREIVPPDGFNHRVEMSYAGIRAVHRTMWVRTALDDCDPSTAGDQLECPVTTSEIYDRHGQLVRVRERSDPGLPTGVTVDTNYGYDAAGRLRSVSTTAHGVTQVRSFSYDGRGFLLSETHPER
jgi:hypothetical protein